MKEAHLGPTPYPAPGLKWAGIIIWAAPGCSQVPRRSLRFGAEKTAARPNCRDLGLSWGLARADFFSRARRKCQAVASGAVVTLAKWPGAASKVKPRGGAGKKAVQEMVFES